MILQFKFISFFICITLLLCSEIFSQWDNYPTYDAFLEIMNKFEADNPTLCKIEEIGESVQGRKLLVAKVSDNVTEDEAEPGVFFISTIHGDETCGFILMLHLIDSLLTGYANSTRIKNLVDNIEIWICPIANPDGAYYGTNPWTTPRRYNANGVDLDRNFPYVTGNVPNPEKETQAIMDFLTNHNMTMAATLHGGVEAVIYPWHCSNEHHPDEDWFVYVAQEYANTAQTHSPDGYFDDLGGDGIGHAYHEFYEVHGTFLDYAIHFAHCRIIHIELSSQKFLKESELLNHWNYNYRSILQYMEKIFYGFIGKTVNWLGQDPVEGKVKVTILNHDNDSSIIRSQLPHGDFYRPIYPGKYTLTFKFNPYSPDTLHNIQLRENELIKLKIKMQDIMDTSQVCLFLASPYGGEIWERGKSYNIIWYNRSVKLIQIFKDSIIVDSINLPSASMDAYLWEIPSDFPTGNDYRIRVSGYGAAISDSTFSIIDQSTTIENPVIKPITPDKNLIVCYGQGNISIHYTLPYSTSVKLEAYDIKGKLVKIIIDKFMQKGSYSVNWDSKRFSSGVYYLKLFAGNNSIVEKAILIK